MAKSKREIYNEQNNISFVLNFHTNDPNDVRIDKFVNGVWDNQFDGNWNKKQAENKLFEIKTGCTKKQYKLTFNNYVQ